MAENKKSFMLYCDILPTIEKLAKTETGDKKVAELFLTILRYVNDKNPVPQDPVVDIVFEPIKQQLKRDLKKWEKSVDTKKENGALGNLKRWATDLYNKVLNGELSLQEALFIAEDRKTSLGDNSRQPDIAKIAVTDTVTVTDTVNVKVIEKENSKNSLIETFFNDLPNSSQFERVSIQLAVTKEILIKAIPEFKKGARVSYPNFNEFVDHFKNWYRKRPTTVEIVARPKKLGQ